MEKGILRKRMLENRSNLTPEEITEKSNIIQNKLFNLDVFKESEFIFSFISFGDEIDTHDIIRKSIASGKRIGVPITIHRDKRLLVSEMMDFEKELEIGYYNILTPKKEFIREVSADIIDLVLVPGLIFSPEGYRVGYGGGYYDRFFGQNKGIYKIGLCFEMQIAEDVPKDRYDIPVDCIITEKRIINCG